MGLCSAWQPVHSYRYWQESTGMRSASWCPQMGQVRVDSRMTAVFSMAGFYTAARPSGLRPASQILQDGGRRASEMVAERVAEMAVAAETEVERQVREPFAVLRQLLQGC